MERNYTYYLLPLLLTSSIVTAQQYSWKPRTDFGGSVRNGSFGFSIDSLGYIGGGTGFGYYSDFWQFHPATNSWTQKSDIPVAIDVASSFVINGKGFVTGGATNISNNTTLYVYDPIANSWSTKATYPGIPIYGAAAFAIGSKGYFGVGNAGNAYGPFYSDWYEYDATTDTWSQKATFPGLKRFGTYGISLNGKGYVGFGGDPNFVISYSDWWEYDPTSDSWTQKASIPNSGRDYPSGFTINNLIYVGVGDFYATKCLKDFYEYNPTTDTWSQKQDYGGGQRTISVGFSIGNIGYFGVGYDYSANRNDFWEYSPDSVSLPVATFQSSDSATCANNCINYTDLSTNATSWLWSFLGATPSSSTDENPQNICYFQSGRYNVSLIASNVGGSDTLNLTNYITVYPAPMTPVIMRSGDSLLCSSDSTYITYQWYFNNSIIPGATNPLYLITQNGNYNIAVTDKNGCQISVGILLGIKSDQANSYLNIYPNPVNNCLTISTLTNFHQADIEIHDIFGKKMYQRVIDSNKDKLTIDVGSFAQGIYFISFNTDGERVTRKILKVFDASE